MASRWGWALGTAAASAVALSMPLMACGGSSRAHEAAAVGPRAVATPSSSTPLPASSIPPKPLDAPPLVVKLLDPGAPPRRELRYAFQQGAIEHFEADIRVASLRTLDSRPQEVFEPPTVRVNGRLQAKHRDADGVVLFATMLDHWEVLDDVKLEPEVRRLLESEIAALDGLICRVWVSPRGHVEGVNFQMRKAVERLKPLMMALPDVLARGFAPFPSEAIGVGARWDVESPDEVTDVRPTRHDVYSLLEADEGGATIERGSICSATPQLLPPPHETVQLDLYDVRGTGQLHPFFTTFIGGGHTSSSQLRMEASPRGGLGTRVVWSHGSIVHVRPARHDVPR